jgi:hypothetical protein
MLGQTSFKARWGVVGEIEVVGSARKRRFVPEKRQMVETGQQHPQRLGHSPRTVGVIGSEIRKA